MPETQSAHSQAAASKRLSICPSGPLRAAICADRDGHAHRHNLTSLSVRAARVMCYLALFSILDGPVKHRPQLQEALHPALQVDDLKGEEG